MLALVKQQSLDSCLASDLIVKDSSRWWYSNPMGTVTNSESLQRQSLLQVQSELTGFIDGSLKSKNGQGNAGIGGFIQKQNGNAIFTFSGPCNANSPVEVEWCALCFLIKKFAQLVWADKSLLVYVDCKPLINRFLEIYSHARGEGDTELAMQIVSRKINIKLIPRELNNVADLLAKSGAHKLDISKSWAFT